MRDLKSLREGWEEIEVLETELLRQRTIHEKVRAYLDLRQTFRPLLEQKAHIYQAEREAALIAVQRKLARLAEYEKTHGSLD